MSRRNLKHSLVAGVMLLLLACGTAVVRAQTQLNTLNALLVEIWPDYDRRAVLVLYTVTLPAEQPLPVALTLPLPPDATLNAVARFTADGSNLIDDVAYTVDEEAGTLTLTAAAPRLRIEYYAPYEADGLSRRFTWRWQSPLDVELLNVSVQQPVAAESLTLDPPAANVAVNADGLQYHNSQPSFAPAGQLIALTLQYTLTADRLTAGEADSAPLTGTMVREPLPAGPLVAIGIGSTGLLAIGLFLLWQWRAARVRPVKPRPQRPAVRRAPADASGVRSPSNDANRFCPHCGQPVGTDDRFCRACGKDLR